MNMVPESASYTLTRVRLLRHARTNEMVLAMWDLRNVSEPVPNLDMPPQR